MTFISDRACLLAWQQSSENMLCAFICGHDFANAKNLKLAAATIEHHTSDLDRHWTSQMQLYLTEMTTDKFTTQQIFPWYGRTQIPDESELSEEDLRYMLDLD